MYIISISWEPQECGTAGQSDVTYFCKFENIKMCYERKAQNLFLCFINVWFYVCVHIIIGLLS